MSNKLLLAALLAPVLHAQDAPARHPRLHSLVREALIANPEIRAAQKRYEAMRQKRAQETALPDPMVSLSYNSSGSPRPFAGIGVEPVANAGVMVTQELPYPGKRRLRGSIADKEAEAEFQQYQSTQLAVLSRLKQAYFRLQHNYAQEEVLARSRDLLRRLLKITELRYSAGKAQQQDIFKTQTQLSVMEARFIQISRDRRAREAEINSILNRDAGTPLERPNEPHLEPLLASLEELYAFAADNAPMIRRDEKMIQKTELAYNLARKELYPDFAVTGGYYYMGMMPDMYMARVDITIPLFRGKRAVIAEQAATLAGSKRTLESSTRSLQARIKDDYLMATTALQLMKLYSDTVIPQSGLTLESALAGYEAGTMDFMAVLMNAMTSVEYEMNVHEEMENYHMALARLEEMTGFPLIH